MFLYVPLTIHSLTNLTSRETTATVQEVAAEAGAELLRAMNTAPQGLGHVETQTCVQPSIARASGEVSAVGSRRRKSGRQKWLDRHHPHMLGSAEQTLGTLYDGQPGWFLSREGLGGGISLPRRRSRRLLSRPASPQLRRVPYLRSDLTLHRHDPIFVPPCENLLSRYVYLHLW